MTDIWDNCRHCDEELTFDEQKILKDECFNCLEQVAN